MNTNVKRIAAQPVVRSYPVQMQISGHSTTGLRAWFCECGGNDDRAGNDDGGGHDSENEASYKDWE